MKVKINEVRAVLVKALVDRGLAKKEAGVVANEYLEGELQGKTSHGLMAFPSLLEKVGGKAKPFNIKKETNSMVLIDANENIGAWVGNQAADIAIEKAKKEGIGLALIKNMVTWLRPGTVAQKIAEKGYVGLVFNNGGSPITAPPGGYDPVVGTNPIGIGIPTSKKPIIVDMATSTKAWGEVRKAERFGENLPKDIYFDNKGKFAVKPEDAYSALAMGNYKGFSLALLIEILTGSFIGRKMGKGRKKVDYRTLPRGGVIIVLNPRMSTSFSKFANANSTLVKEIKSSRKLKGTKEIVLPGERGLRAKVINFKKGYLEIEKELWEKLH
ncbi:Ldh family oxidoreductase [Patescibacteria group bacterium]|nr:Ldh family oxidoreductase [Patescibacteria group bacterium]